MGLRQVFARRAAEDRPLIARVGVEFAQEREQAEQRRQDEAAAVAVLNAGMMHDGVHQEALRVGEDMPLLAQIPAFAGTSLLPAS